MLVPLSLPVWGWQQGYYNIIISRVQTLVWLCFFVRRNDMNKERKVKGDKAFGQQLKIARKKSRLTQRQVADTPNMERCTYARHEVCLVSNDCKPMFYFFKK